MDEERDTVYRSGYEDRLSHTPADPGRWAGERGESLCLPRSAQSREICQRLGADGVQYRDGVPDFSPFSESTVMIGHMVPDRTNQRDEYGFTEEGNYAQADVLTAQQWTQRDRESGKVWSAADVRNYREDNNLTWHECNDLETMQLIPTAINNDFRHLGGVGEAKAEDRILDEIDREEGVEPWSEDDDYALYEGAASRGFDFGVNQADEESQGFDFGANQADEESQSFDFGVNQANEESQDFDFGTDRTREDENEETAEESLSYGY